jgi:hypothetical protein
MTLDDWFFASTPIVLHKSSSSVLVIPSSLASSWTRMFFAKTQSAFRWRHALGNSPRDRQLSHVESGGTQCFFQPGERAVPYGTSPCSLEPTSLHGLREADLGAQPCPSARRRSADLRNALAVEDDTHQTFLRRRGSATDAGTHR